MSEGSKMENSNMNALDKKNETAPSGSESKMLIEAEGINKTYNKGKRNANEVLSDASISLPQQGFVFIVGKSGIGKSTILNAIGGLISYEGQILYDKQQVDIEQYRRKNIGYIFQDFLLFDELSIRDNIRIVLNLNGIYDEEEISRRVGILLSAVGLNVNASRRASALSLGQRQRVAIARALASNPRIILADEPTGNLDSKNSLIVMDILKKLSLNHLVVCVTHNVNLVNLYADKAYAIIDKKFTEINPKSEQLEDTYKNVQQIDVGEMKKSDFSDDSFLISLYSSSADKEKTVIKLIKKDGKILVIGNNISVLTPEEAELEEQKKEEEKQTQEVKKEEAVNLDFPPRQDKKTFKDTKLYELLSGLTGTQEKVHFGKGLLRFAEIILPLVLFFLIDASLGLKSNIDNYKIPYNHPDNLILFAPTASEGSLGNNSLSGEQMADLFMDSDSKLIEGQMDIGDYGPNGYNQQFNDPRRLELPLADFSVSGALVSPQYANGVTVNVNICNIASYSSIKGLTELQSFNLADDEIVIDKKLLTTASSLSYFEGDLSSLITKEPYNKLNIPYFYYGSNYYVNSHSFKTYTIKGIVDTGYSSVFSNAKTSAEFRSRYEFYSNGLTQSSAFQMPFDISGFEFIEYKEAEKDTATYTISQVKSNFATPTEYGEGLPLAYVSKAAKDVIGDYSDSALLRYDPAYEIERNDDPSHTHKIIAFYDYAFGNDNINSSLAFRNSYFGNEFRTRPSYISSAPSNLNLTWGQKPKGTYEVLVPSTWCKLDSTEMKFKSFYSNSEEEYTIVGIYESTSLTDPIYFSDYSYFVTVLGYHDISLNYAGFYGQSFEDIVIANSPHFLSSDPDKTIEYFNNHSEYHLTAYKYSYLYGVTFTSRIYSSLRSIIIAIGILVGLMAGIIAMDAISRINKEKYRFGVLRCLGMSKKSIVGEDIIQVLFNAFFACVLPCCVFGILLGVFGLYYYGFIWLMAFFLAYLAIVVGAAEIPLLILLAKKPNDIIRTLS
jgi:ABC-type lipoprotein export system ATPase subunit